MYIPTNVSFPDKSGEGVGGPYFVRENITTVPSPPLSKGSADIPYISWFSQCSTAICSLAGRSQDNRNASSDKCRPTVTMVVRPGH
ncbi:hypothetical protein SCLCIDRAFT_761001 [Scleroderma citrinum Foug A]|uniref:Uncharacterized protein n=1 Tax=Scleroderma citrinum Foug A TaxID=1036808 RepID=A0A0C3AE65_9AGAM|nr:hypothetical protein SCLCIDRAFT_761001 [Scleroderma citrinum Foug A]